VRAKRKKKTFESEQSELEGAHMSNELESERAMVVMELW
jgi:hypothetical protein